MENEHMNEESETPRDPSRRDFLRTVGVGSLEVTVLAGSLPLATPPLKGRDETVPLTLIVNGQECRLQVEPRWTLLYVLRERLGLTGTKPGCERGECGACTVLVDDEPRYSCMTLALEAAGRRITTVEGLMKGEELGVVQKAFAEEDAFQCGFCTPGQVMAAEGLLRRTPKPAMDEIRTAMSGNLCRCGAYDHIFKAVWRASAAQR
jgi:xanthine dehydrogenase YagT iron-sulfur-binding subunit